MGGYKKKLKHIITLYIERKDEGGRYRRHLPAAFGANQDVETVKYAIPMMTVRLCNVGGFHVHNFRISPRISGQN